MSTMLLNVPPTAFLLTSSTSTATSTSSSSQSSEGGIFSIDGSSPRSTLTSLPSGSESEFKLCGENEEEEEGEFLPFSTTRSSIDNDRKKKFFTSSSPSLPLPIIHAHSLPRASIISSPSHHHNTYPYPLSHSHSRPTRKPVHWTASLLELDQLERGEVISSSSHYSVASKSKSSYQHKTLGLLTGLEMEVLPPPPSSSFTQTEGMPMPIPITSSSSSTSTSTSSMSFLAPIIDMTFSRLSLKAEAGVDELTSSSSSSSGDVEAQNLNLKRKEKLSMKKRILGSGWVRKVMSRDVGGNGNVTNLIRIGRREIQRDVESGVYHY